jgi:signal transduction histidine kinase
VPRSLLWTAGSLSIATGGALWALLFTPDGGAADFGAAKALVVLATMLAVWITQYWRVSVRGTRGDVSMSVAVDVFAFLLFDPLPAALGSGAGVSLYHLFQRDWQRGLVRGLVTFASVGIGGWTFHTLRPLPLHAPLDIASDGIYLLTAVALRLAIRVVLYPMGMAAVRRDPSLQPAMREELARLPIIPFLLTTTLGVVGVLLWEYQPWAILLLGGPATAVWALVGETQRLNDVTQNLESTVHARTSELAATVQQLERRLSEAEAIQAVDRALIQSVQVDEILQVIVRESCRVTRGTSALITLLTEDRQHQYIRAVHGGLDDYLGMEIPIEGSLTGLVIATGEPQLSTAPRLDPRLHQRLVEAGRWEAVVEAPLRAKDRILGVLVVGADCDCFDGQSLRLLTVMANQAGLILENTRLHEKATEVAVLEERNRLARELHDSVTQSLFSLSLNLEAAGQMVGSSPDKARSLVGRSAEMASEALAEMRSLIFELRPAALQEKGLMTALTNHLNLFRRRHGLEVNLSLDGEDRLPPDIEFCLYRVAQEALTNIVKHAQATRVQVSYTVSSHEARLRVADDGVGFEPGEAPGAQSFGLLGMRERVGSIGGTLTVASLPGRGTAVEARIPLREGAA